MILAVPRERLIKKAGKILGRWGKASRPIYYPESDGKPMADNPKQGRIIALLAANIEILFADAPEVWIGRDQFWYPVEGNKTICQAPDVFIVIGRPNDERSTYCQWGEENIAPQVVFEVLSPSNTRKEMERKFEFYQKYGVEEYYVIDPYFRFVPRSVSVYLRGGKNLLLPAIFFDGFTSPRLGIKFAIDGKEFRFFNPDGTPFLSHREIHEKLEAERLAKEAANRLANEERLAKEAERARADELANFLRKLGYNPDDLSD